MKMNKGVFLCLSGNANLKIDSLRLFIDYLSLFGYGTLELGLDDMIKIPEEPYYGYLRGGYKIQELQSLDEYARKKGIELIPSCQMLGHFGYLKKIPEYDSIIDIDDILLIGEERTTLLLKRLIHALRLAFKTKHINIGFDEAHHVGLGKYLDKHGYRNRYDLLLEHLNLVNSLCKKEGFEPEMWSDMFFKLANKGIYYDKEVKLPQSVLEKIPDGMRICYWDYFTTDKETISHMIEEHKRMKRPLSFAGTITNFAGFAPANYASIEILRKQLPTVLQNGIDSVLITIWGDDGNDVCPFSCLPGLFAASCFLDGIYDKENIAESFYKKTGMSYDAFLTLDEPNRTPVNPTLSHVSISSKSLFYNDPFLGWKDCTLETVGAIDYEKARKELKKAKKMIAKDFLPIFEKEEALCSFLSLKYDLGLKTRTFYQKGDKEGLRGLLPVYTKCQKRLSLFEKKFQEEWFLFNRPYGWDVQTVRLGGLILRLEECKERLSLFIDGKNEKIEELEDELLPYAPFDSAFNLYSGFVSVRNL